MPPDSITTVTCNDCRRRLRAPVDLVRTPTNKYVVDRFHAGAGIAVPQATVFEEFLTPARAATVSSDVAVPFLQAMVTGVMTILLAIAPVYALGLPWQVTLLAGAIALCMTWVYLLADHRRSLWSRERYEHEPATVAPAPPSPKNVKVKLEVNEGASMKYAHLPIDSERLIAMARAINNGRSFAVSVWSGRGKLLSRSEFEGLRAWLIESDYAKWKDDRNRQLGIEFTRKGDALWRGLAES